MPSKPREGTFAAELEDILKAKDGPKEVHMEDEQPVLDDADDWKAELAGEPVGKEPKLRMRGTLEEAFTSGPYKGKAVSKKRAFEEIEEESADGAEEGEEEVEEVEEMEEGEEEGDEAAPTAKDVLIRDEDEGSEDSWGVVKGGKIDRSAIERKMDSIFALLEEESDEEEPPGETYDDYAKKLETRVKRKILRKPLQLEDDDEEKPIGTMVEMDGDDVILQQIKEIKEANEKALKGLVRKSEVDREKAVHVKNQYRIWGQLVACRIQLQSAMTAASRIPGHYAFKDYEQKVPEMTNHLSSASRSLVSLLVTLHRLREALTTPKFRSSDALKCPQVSEDLPTPLSKADLVKCWKLCVASHSTVESSLWNAMEEWHKRTQPLNSKAEEAKMLEGGPQPIAQQIEQSLRQSDRFVRRTQRHRGTALPFGDPRGEDVAKNPKLMEVPDYMYNPEIYDDSDFYSWLLNDYIHNCAEATKADAIAALATHRSSKDPSKQTAERKGSKARKLSFEPIPKAVGFMAPAPQEEMPMLDGLYASLFKG